jgi:hypothetical protein
MRKKLLRSLTALTFIAAAFSITAWSLSLLHQRRINPQSSDAEKSKRKTLREIARERDVEIVGHVESEAEYDDMRSLAKAANAIVVGRITAAESSFDGDDNITTTHQVNVQRVLRDATSEVPLLPGWTSPTPLTPTFKLIRHGGVVEVNGHKASARADGQESLVVGKDYILFLWWSPNSNAYYLAGGNSGAILIDSDRRVKPLGRTAKAKYRDFNIEAFISEVLK